MAIQQITQGAKKVRMRLTNDLGEAASRVKAAQQKLANSDQNPSMALKAAVDDDVRDLPCVRCRVRQINTVSLVGGFTTV